MTREAWLTEAVRHLTEDFKGLGHDVPEVRVSMGWPHGGRPSTIGQCFPGAMASDGIGHIFISPMLSEPAHILAVLLHELVHAVNHVDGNSGHGKEFAAIAKPLGLTGKMTATVAGEHLQTKLEELAIILGEFPHAALTPSASSAGSTRSGKLVKVVCAEGDDFVVSMAKTRLANYGAPICPCHNTEMVKS